MVFEAPATARKFRPRHLPFVVYRTLRREMEVACWSPSSCKAVASFVYIFKPVGQYLWKNYPFAAGKMTHLSMEK